MGLRLAETGSSTWFYHLVESDLGPERQGKLVAICGAEFIGWETLIPIGCWGQKDHIGSRYCRACTAIKQKG